MLKKIPYTDALFIKNYSEYENAFQKIEQLNYLKLSYDDMKELIEIKYKIPILQNFYPILGKSEMELYRIRRVSEFKEDKNLISSFSAPPNTKSKIGRANIANKSVLYVTMLPQTAIQELNIQKGEEIYFSMWKFKKNTTIGGAVFLKNKDLMPASWNKIICNQENRFRQKLLCYNKEISDSCIFIRDKISEWFLKENDYSLSSFLAHYCLYDTDLSAYGYTIDCIIYPSVGDGFRTSNIAISTNSIRKIDLKYIIRGYLNEINDKGIILNVIEIGRPENFEINWKIN